MKTPWDPRSVLLLSPTKQNQKQRQALVNWKKRVGEKEAQRIVTEAPDNGSMHASLEYWVKNENYTGETTILSERNG